MEGEGAGLAETSAEEPEGGLVRAEESQNRAVMKLRTDYVLRRRRGPHLRPSRV